MPDFLNPIKGFGVTFGWKWLLPAAVVNVILVAAGVIYFS